MSSASEWRRDHEDQDRLSKNLTLLPEIFREHGYQTSFLTTNLTSVHSSASVRAGIPFKSSTTGGMRGWCARPSSFTTSDTVTAAAIDWFDGAQRPFFVVILAVDPH